MPNRIRFRQLILLLPGLLHCLVLILRHRLFRNPTNVNTVGNRKRVLIVKLDAIGDFILWLDVAKELRRVYPPNEYVITLLGNRQWTDLAKTLSYFDEVWAIERPSFFTNCSNYCIQLENLCSVTFDVVLHPVFSREFLFGDLFVLASDAKQKIGMQGDGVNLNWWQKFLGDRIYTDLVPRSIDHIGELEHNASLLRWLGLTDFKVGVPNLEGPFEQKLVQLPSDYYVVIAGASVSLRMWPTSRIIALIERVYLQTGLNAVVCGGKAEESLGKAIKMGTSAPLVNFTGQTSLSDLAAIISKAHYVVANETGAVHIAAALGVPSVCIVGGGHFGRFIPYSSGIITSKKLPVPVFKQMECFGCNWKCIYNIPLGEAAPCIEAVSLEMVLSAVMAIFEHQRDSR